MVPWFGVVTFTVAMFGMAMFGGMAISIFSGVVFSGVVFSGVFPVSFVIRRAVIVFTVRCVLSSRLTFHRRSFHQTIPVNNVSAPYNLVSLVFPDRSRIQVNRVTRFSSIDNERKFDSSRHRRNSLHSSSGNTLKLRKHHVVVA